MHNVKVSFQACYVTLKSGESSLEIDNNELTDFLKTVKGTFGILTTDIGESIRHFFFLLCMYHSEMTTENILKYPILKLNLSTPTTFTIHLAF